MLMLIVLIQRGKGGGLAGAFGGAGGSSPFGSRAADQFVKITLWLAGVWVLVIMIQVKVVKYDSKDQANTPGHHQTAVDRRSSVRVTRLLAYRVVPL